MKLTAPASVMDFGRKWQFHFGEAKGAEAPDHDDHSWEKVTLPHTFNARDTFIPARGYYRGPAWYRKAFRRPRPGGHVFLRFDAAWGKVHVWLNGRDLGEHIDGLVGFELEITEGLVTGQNNVAVRVDNSHDPRVLPGKPIPDYNIYGGLCGNVWLTRKPRVHFPWRCLDISTTQVGEVRADVDILADVAGDGGREAVRAIATITDPAGTEIPRTGKVSPSVGRTFSFHFEITDPALWSPDAPSLYDVQVDLLVEGEVVDREVERFGIRTFAFDESDGFILNGERLQLRGVNRHQDLPGLGNVLPPRLARRDVELIREMGGNFVRTSHYPQHPSFLDACDELGVMVYEEIATWQFIGGNGFIESADNMMAAMIRRDRNHPSIILWGMMNEGRSRRMFERLKQTAIATDPSRPTIYADNKLADGVHLETVFIPHVLGMNYRLESIDAFHSAYPHIKLLVSEHTNADRTVRGLPDLERIQSERIAADLDIIESRPFVAGTTLWSMHDYGTDYEPVWPVQKSGILDAYRNPKEAFHMLAARWRPDPIIRIASDWNTAHEDGDEVEVRVYTNCDEVELTLNGRTLDSKPGANPVVWQVPYAPGELQAFGGREGQTVVTDSMATPGPASRIELSCPREIRADGRDALIMAARITDENGNIVPGFADEVAFTVKGPGRLLGMGESTSATAVAGMANMVLKSLGRKGTISLKASVKGIKPGSLIVSSL